MVVNSTRGFMPATIRSLDLTLSPFHGCEARLRGEIERVLGVCPVNETWELDIWAGRETELRAIGPKPKPRPAPSPWERVEDGNPTGPVAYRAYVNDVDDAEEWRISVVTLCREFLAGHVERGGPI